MSIINLGLTPEQFTIFKAMNLHSKIYGLNDTVEHKHIALMQECNRVFTRMERVEVEYQEALRETQRWERLKSMGTRTEALTRLLALSGKQVVLRRDFYALQTVLTKAGFSESLCRRKVNLDA